ncbi:putative Ubiquitin [Tripterygium wilfordii]|uniref:Putative Ubiquitin n=1 Tax=Tripterygium wilfordii TaxID=458696 RepID=A0A7J7CFM6_TRIWF|nr:putative Ubiquitin [Tripterygium wilfordii]
MKIIFQTPRGNRFKIENINYYDTVMEIKQKIHDKRGIPADQQLLIFNEKILTDAATVYYCGLSDKIDGGGSKKTGVKPNSSE